MDCLSVDQSDSAQNICVDFEDIGYIESYL
jgi:hypothetical protein